MFNPFKEKSITYQHAMQPVVSVQGGLPEMMAAMCQMMDEMSKQGWEYVGMTSVTAASSPLAGSRQALIWILTFRRPSVETMDSAVSNLHLAN